LTAPTRSLCVVGFLAGLAIRLAFLLSFPGDFDTDSYRIVASIVERRGDPYAETTRYNYSPVWSFVLRGAAIVADQTGASLTLVVGLLLTAVDLATAALLYGLARSRQTAQRSLLTALLFFLNPISVLMSSYHCQFDNVSILFLLLAVWFAERSRQGSSTASLSASLLAKHVTWFHPLLFARGRSWRGAAALATPYLLFLASFLPYAGSRERIWRQVFQHRGLTGYYGTEAMLLLPGVPEWLPTALFVVAATTAALLLRGLEIRRASLLLFLVILIFLPGFGGQYCVWPITLGALCGGPGFFLFTVVTSGFFLRIVLRLDRVFPLLPGWYAPWWAAIAWLLWEIRRLPPGAIRPGSTWLKIGRSAE
jgi:hypothetical protein